MIINFIYDTIRKIKFQLGKIAKDSNKVGMKVAAEIINLLKVKKDAVLGLATGGTAESVYPHLIKSYNKKEIDFKKVKTINLDEYNGLDG